MRKDRYQLLSIVIIGAVVLTIAIQGYWNYRNYQVHRQHFKNDVQQALDQGLETYFTNRAKLELFDIDSRRVTVIKSDTLETKSNITLSLDHRSFFPVDSGLFETDSLRIEFIDSIENNVDTIVKVKKGSFHMNHSVFSSDSLGFEDLAAKIIIAMEADQMDTAALRVAVNDQLQRMGMEVDYFLWYQGPLSPVQDSSQATSDRLMASANAAFLAPGTSLTMHYQNNTLEILKRGLTGIAISLLTALVILAVLWYLYKIIKDQKEIAEIKNDLISNLTHEFKTPIATVATALEGIEKFNDQNDPNKTKKYLDISTQQLKRLNHMVEKLLETATLEQDQLSLKVESTNISQLVEALCAKYAVLDDRNIAQDIQPDLLAQVDVFHFENAISNLLDNAIKYGGKNIKVQLKKHQDNCTISVQDDGEGIKQGQQEKVFDKFYRIPTGNQHDVKGYGIGLYYSRKIIEKHGGELRLSSKPHQTEFTMIL